ncbi:DgyrCDS4116 [Dimorphilus gyrociliatus]|uniref:DgyrCDS4116 n=1 Tax=Dimorphilus gyrociliatus TaxID=2664684 RepID=A0A7I8VFG5_9ANNE|nr:DgyrCDS4116 [Dimorphilus gyrociliatus]
MTLDEDSTLLCMEKVSELSHVLKKRATDEDVLEAVDQVVNTIVNKIYTNKLQLKSLCLENSENHELVNVTKLSQIPRKFFKKRKIISNSQSDSCSVNDPNGNEGETKRAEGSRDDGGFEEGEEEEEEDDDEEDDDDEEEGDNDQDHASIGSNVDDTSPTPKRRRSSRIVKSISPNINYDVLEDIDSVNETKDPEDKDAMIELKVEEVQKRGTKRKRKKKCTRRAKVTSSPKAKTIFCFLCDGADNDEKVCYSSWLALVEHFKKLHFVREPNTSYLSVTCPQCPKKYMLQGQSGTCGRKSLQKLLHHMHHLHSLPWPEYVNLMKCNYCEFQTSFPRFLESHEMKHTNKKEKCEYCNALYLPTMKNLHKKKCPRWPTTEAMDEGDGEKRTRGRPRVNVCELDPQAKKEAGKKLCTTCGEFCSNNTQLMHHAFIKHKVNMFNKPVEKCPECGVELLAGSLFRKHMQQHDRVEHCCDICGKVFKNRLSVIRHRSNNHTAKKRFPCPYCDYAPRKKSAIDRHIRLHLKTGKAEVGHPERRRHVKDGTEGPIVDIIPLSHVPVSQEDNHAQKDILEQAVSAVIGNSKDPINTSSILVPTSFTPNTVSAAPHQLSHTHHSNQAAVAVAQQQAILNETMQKNLPPLLQPINQMGPNVGISQFFMPAVTGQMDVRNTIPSFPIDVHNRMYDPGQTDTTTFHVGGNITFQHNV